MTNDTQLLNAKRPIFAGYLNPQGRVLALIYLLPHSSGTLAIMPRELLHATADRLRKFVLRAKVKIEVPDESLALFGYHGTEALAQAGLPLPTDDEPYLERDGVGVARLPHDPDRFWVVGAAQGVATNEQAAAQPHADHAAEGLQAQRAQVQDAQALWRRADVAAGLPQVYGATSEAFVAQMLNLDLLDGISFKKGCYTGQEIVARTQHLGRIKRRLFRLRLPRGSWQIGDEVRVSDGRVGRLTEVVDADEGSEALAVLAVDPAVAEVPAPGAPLEPGASDARLPTILPLPYAVP